MIEVSEVSTRPRHFAEGVSSGSTIVAVAVKHYQSQTFLPGTTAALTLDNARLPQ